MIRNIRPHSISTFTKAYTRKRRWYLLAIIVTILLGLSSRRFPILFLAFLGKYPGDAFWSLVVFFSWGFVLPSVSTYRVASLTLITSYAVEFLKLYQAPWLVSLRQTTLGYLVLGHAFSWQNFIAYTSGVGLGLVIEFFLYSGRSQFRNQKSVGR